jgi:hypothetical protein
MANLWLMQFVSLEDGQIYNHHYATWVSKVVKTYCQAHGFNDDGIK